MNLYSPSNTHTCTHARTTYNHQRAFGGTGLLGDTLLLATSGEHKTSSWQMKTVFLFLTRARIPPTPPTCFQVVHCKKKKYALLSIDNILKVHTWEQRAQNNTKVNKENLHFRDQTHVLHCIKQKNKLPRAI